MASNKTNPERFDDRNLQIETDLGGTARLFELSRTIEGGMRSRVGDGFGDVATVEWLWGKESLFEVTYPDGTKSAYDHEGNLQKVVVSVASFFDNLNENILAQVESELLEAIGAILLLGTEIVMEVDLRGGLTEGDGMGWVQLICKGEAMKKVSPGIGGFEIAPEGKMDLYSVLLTDLNDEELGRLNLRVEIRQDHLYIGLGGNQALLATRYFLQANPDLVFEIGTPEGALTLLGSLVPQG